MIRISVLITLVVAVFVLRIANFIGDIWIGFGAIALLVIAAIIYLLPAWKKTVSVLFFGWIILFLILPVLTGKTKEQLQHTATAIEQQGVWGDLFTSEKIRPHGLQDITAFRRWADKMESVGGQYITQQYEGLYNDYQRGTISREKLLEKDALLRRQIIADVRWRKESSGFIQEQEPKEQKLKNDEASFFSGLLDSLKSSQVAGSYLIFGVILFLLGLFISKITPWKKIAGLTALIGVAAMILGLSLFFVPGLQAKLTTDGGSGKDQIITHRAARTPAAATRLPANAIFATTLPEGKIVYVKRKRMDVPPPERWSKDSNGGKVTIVRAWPHSEEIRSYRNDLPGTDNLYFVLPPGLSMADFEISDDISPALKQVAQASTTSNCLLDREFGKSTAEQKLAKAFQEGKFNNK